MTAGAYIIISIVMIGLELMFFYVTMKATASQGLLTEKEANSLDAVYAALVFIVVWSAFAGALFGVGILLS